MQENVIELTRLQYHAFSLLRKTHCYATIRCADAVDTLAGDNDSLMVRGKAYAMIQELARVGVVKYHTGTETVRVLPLKIHAEQNIGSLANEPVTNTPSLKTFIENLTLSRIRAVWEMILIYREQGKNPLPSKLAELIILRLRKKYPAEPDVLTTPAQGRQLIYHLREYEFLETTEMRGAYRLTVDAIDLVPTIESLLLPNPRDRAQNHTD